MSKRENAVRRHWYDLAGDLEALQNYWNLPA